MPTCFNCRANVLAGVERCPSCGMTFVPGTWRTAITSLSTSADGWGLSRTTRQGRWFQVVALLVPLWVPLLMVFFVDAPATALALLLAPFVFIPRVHTIGNVPGWSGWARFAASLGYVATSGVLGFLVMSWFNGFLRQSRAYCRRTLQSVGQPPRY